MSREWGDIFLTFSDSKQEMPNDRSISAIPAIVANTIGILNVHFTMPSELKNNAVSGLIIIQLKIIPITVEIIIAGINESAVCKISCLVVNPSDLSIP